MAVTYNGQTTNFTGKGSPNPQKLVIPYKDKMDETNRAAALAIEQFVNNLVSPAGGGYASLTGAGQTTTPGALTQLGPFSITATVSPGVTITTSMSSGYGFTANMTSAAGILLEQQVGGAGCEIRMQPAGAGIGIVCPGPITLNAWGTNEPITLQSAKLSFFGGPTGTQPTVSGSRGGNAALASLLTGLASLGLIIDSSTP